MPMLLHVVLLNAEVTFRSKNFQKQYMRDMNAFDATSAEMDQKLANLTTILEKESANSNMQEEDKAQLRG